jgi:pSer/pThr/pTyr-binding forkhead associated (FHA) protein
VLPLEVLHREALKCRSEQEFLSLHPCPVLLVNPDTDTDEEMAPSAVLFNTMKIATRGNVENWISQTHEDLDVSMLAADNTDAALTQGTDPEESIQGQQVAFVTKRENGNPFAHMITFGRVPNNDIVLSLPSISKVHGYLHRDAEDRWWIYDQRSTNGTWVNRVRVPPGDRAPLHDGAFLNVGPSLGLKFFLPGTFFAFLKGLSGRLPDSGDLA